MKKTLLFLLNIYCIIGFSQEYRMLNGDNGVKVTCSGTFTDSGGTAALYGNNHTSTITFTPVNPGDAIRVYFTTFNLEGTGAACYDYLQVWHNNTITNPALPDETYCGLLQPFTITSNNLSNGSLTFKFTSNFAVQKAGWFATISCITPCHPPTAALAGASDVALCNSPVPQTVTLDASGSSSPLSQFSITNYEWSWGDGIVTTTSTPTASHTYSQYGIYRASVRVYDNNYIATPGTGCASTNSALKYIRVLPPPTYNATTTTLTSTCGQSVNLQSIARSSNINEVIPSVSTAPIHLPDGEGTSVESEINLTGYFASGATVSSGCYPTIKFNIEHSFARDLTIDLIAPNGQTVRLFNRNFANGENFGTCVNGNDDNIAGCPAEYTVVASGGANWLAASSFTSATTSCPSYTGPCESGSYSISQAYNSIQSFTSLIGAPLNGIWKLKITDNQIYDDGFFAGWSITFPNTCYTNLQNSTTTLTNMNWTSGTGSPAIASQNTTFANLSNPGPNNCPTSSCIGTLGTSSATVGPFTQAGTYTYINTVTNSLGCTNTQSFTINVTCAGTLTLASNISTLTQNVCDNVTITPIVFNFTGNASSIIASLPTGLTSTISGNTMTITGNITSDQTFTVSMTGVTQTYTVAITVMPSLSNVVINGGTNYCYYSTNTFTSNVPGGTWSCSCPEVLMSSTSGKAELRALGDCIIYYTVSNGCGTVTVSKNIKMFLYEKTILVGPSIVCINTPGVFMSCTTTEGTWESSDTTIADIDSVTGEVFPHTPGLVTFSYTLLNYCGTLILTKNVAIANIEFPTLTSTGTMYWDSATSSYTPVTINTATTFPAEYIISYYLNGTLLYTETDAHSYTVTQPGTYTVVCNYPKSSCTTEGTITISAASPPVVKTSVLQNGTSYTIDVLAESTDINKDSNSYQYQLDNGSFQTNATFYNVKMGIHNITVKDINSPTQTSAIVETIGYTKFFTPNNDGANDTWTIENFDTELKECTIQIFSRNNSLVGILNNTNTNWNGNDLKGNPLPTDDYWFIATFKDDYGNLREIKKHFTLKRD